MWEKYSYSILLDAPPSQTAPWNVIPNVEGACPVPPITFNNKRIKKGHVKNYHKNCSHFLLAKVGSCGLWSNIISLLKISWGASLKTSEFCLYFFLIFFVIYRHSLPFPLTFLKEKKIQNRQVRGGEDFHGYVLRGSK